MKCDEMVRVIHSVNVNCVDIDAQTRCAHYHTDLDIIAIKFKCCGRWFPCFECHQACAGHPAQVWPADQANEHAILCGACGHQQTIAEYIDGDSICPACDAKFNPACANHRHLYFATPNTL